MAVSHEFLDRHFGASPCVPTRTSPTELPPAPPPRRVEWRRAWRTLRVLIADPEREIIEAYGVWREKKMYGKTVMGLVRSTFVIDGDGVIRQIWRKVKVAGHVDEVLEALKEARKG